MSRRYFNLVAPVVLAGTIGVHLSGAAGGSAGGAPAAPPPGSGGSVNWAVNLWSQLDRAVFWSVPLIPKGASLDAAANGDYDDHYRRAAQTLAASRPQDSKVFVRTGWEFNGDWFPRAAQGNEQAFMGAFRHFVSAFRSVSSRFVFEWNVDIGNKDAAAMNPETAYPGDDYVDIIGMDMYWNTAWDPQDPEAAWQSMVTRQWAPAMAPGLRGGTRQADLVLGVGHRV